MRVKEMHQLCCITPESPGIGEQSPFAGLKLSATHCNAAARLIGSEGSVGGGGVAGVLHKWTNYGKGWRSRWFVLRNGVLSYSKIRRRGDLVVAQAEDVRLIGDLAGVRLCTLDSLGSRRRNQKADRNGRFVQLKITSFRGSRSDDRRFYIFTTRKTLHLRADSSSDCVAWIEALISTRHLYLQRPVSNKVSLALPNAFKNISTQRLRNRLLEEGAGISESLVRDCEQIMLTELHEIHGQINVLYEERSNLLETLRQMEEVNIESESSGIHESDYNMTKPGFSSLVHGKSSESCTTESSDEIEKQEFREASDEAEPCFFDTEEHFSELTLSQHDDAVRSCVENGGLKPTFPFIERRKRLPDPAEKEKGVSLWSMIKDNVGKDLTRVCLPVYFNEPISSLQKCFEDLEYSHLLDEAYKHGKAGNSLLRALNVAAFAVSGYASSDGRHRKPFNPLLGETFEADYPDRGIHFFSEKVSHHPTLIACHCEGKGWKFWGDSNLHSKFRGRSIQLDPVGVLNIEFDDGEVFQWSKVTTTIYNLILGKLYCDHHGMMNISSNCQFSCKLKFKEQSLLDRNPHEVHGFIEDQCGKKAATLSGKWDDSLYYVEGDGIGRCRDMSSVAALLWKRNTVPVDLTRYNLTPFAITLNELTPGLQEKLPPTDSRLRPDQRHLENGEYEKANLEKLRLERRQRMSRKLQESGWKPRWFRQESEEGPYRYVGGYWEAREQGKWDGCLNIFDQFDEDTA